jgi:hypothetical protein
MDILQIAKGIRTAYHIKYHHKEIYFQINIVAKKGSDVLITAEVSRLF